MGWSKGLAALGAVLSLATACDDGTTSTPTAEPYTTISFGELPGDAVEAGGYMWVIDRRGAGIGQIDLDTNEIVGRIDLQAALGSETQAVWDLEALGDHVWVTVPSRHQLLGFSTDTLEIARTTKLPGFVSDIYAAAGSLWMEDKRALVRWDPIRKQVASVPFGGMNTSLGDVVEYEGFLWATREQSRLVAPDDQGLSTWEVEGELIQIDPDRNRIVNVRTLGTTFARGPINPVVGRVRVGEGGLWMSRPYENRMLLLDPFSGEVLLQFPIAAFELTWEFAVVDGDLWVGDLNEPRVMWIDPESRERELVELGAGSSSISSGFGSAWAPVTGRDGGAVVRLDPPS